MKRIDRQKVFTTIPSLWFIVLSGLGMSTVWAADASLSDKPNKPGFYTDSFHILPEFQITAYHDDNIYATQGAGKESDIVTILSPTLKINSRWDKHSLKVDAGMNRGIYLDNTDENYNDYWLEASGRYQVGSATSLFGGAGYNKKHEGRDSKDSAQSADEPTTYNVRSLHAGGRHQLADYVVRLGVTAEKLDYNDAGELINDDRDRTQNGLGLRVTRGLDKRTKVFAQGLLNTRDYDDELDQNGYNRDSDGYVAAVGMIKTFGKKDKIEAFVGWLSQEYDDPSFDRVSELDYGINLRWYPAQTYKFTGSLNRTLSETTEAGASGYLYTNLNMQLDKKMFTDYVGYISYGHGNADYQQINRDDRINSYGVGLNYYVSRHLFLSGSYSHIDYASSDAENNYKRNLFLISFKAKLAP